MKRVLGLALSLFLLFAALPVLAFDDVPDDDPFRGDIDWLADSGITRGCNPPENSLFCPKDSVTRGQMAAFLVRALSLEPGDATFEDTAGHTFEGDISSLATAGITRGCNPPENSRFCPDDSVTRGQMAAFLVRALGLEPGDATFEDTAGHTFEGDISSLATAGITRGCNPPENSRFCPDDSVTREQMAAFLHRALGEDGPGDPDPSELSGTIYANWDGLSGTAYRYQLDSDDPRWEEFLQGPVEYSDVIIGTNEWVGTTEGAWIQENVVTFFDLDTQVENMSLIWPDSGRNPEREIKIHDLAVSDDGELLVAKITEGLGSQRLEVITRDGAILAHGWDAGVNPSATALEWTPDNDLVVAGLGHNQDDPDNPVPVIGVVPAADIPGNELLEASGVIYFALTETGMGAVNWIALSHDASQIVFVERGNVWVSDFEPGATPRQLTTGSSTALPSDPAWTAQFSPDGNFLALANQTHQQFIIPNHDDTPINLLLSENRQLYQVGDTLANMIIGWFP